MSVTVMSLVFYADGLTPSQKLVLLAMADHANDYGKSIYPAVRRLEIKTGLSERTVQSTLKELRDELKLITITNPASQHKANEYEIDLQKLYQMWHPEVRQLHPNHH